MSQLQVSMQAESSSPETAPDPVAPKGQRTARKSKQAKSFLGLVLANRKAAVGAVILVFFIAIAVFAPFIAKYDPNDFVGRPRQAPNSEFWFGTTGSGKDVFSQTVYGARISLLTGLVVGTIVSVVGTTIGMASGYFGGALDDLLSLATNVMLIIPGIPLLIVLAAFMPPGFWSIVFVLSTTGWAWGARVLRSQTMSFREKDFVSASVVSGEGAGRIMFREILPNMLSIVIANFFGAVSYAIGAQAGLEFLGLGNPSNVSWGTNLYWGQNDQALLTGVWWTIVPSGLCIALVAFSFTLINYAIDEVTNPRLRSQRSRIQLLKKQPRKIRMSRATPVMPLPSEMKS